jgi:hypothetical protein
VSTPALFLALLTYGAGGALTAYAFGKRDQARRAAAAWRYLADVADAAEPTDVPALSAAGVAVAIATGASLPATYVEDVAYTFGVRP